MKLKIEAKLTKMEPRPTRPWWWKRVSVPMLAVVAAAAAILILGSLLFRRTAVPQEIATGAPAAPAATFVGVDTATRGAWKGKYGTAGYAIAADGRRSSALAEIGPPEPDQSWTWVDDVEDVRAVQKACGAKRIGAAWFGWGPFTIAVRSKGAGTRRLAVYLVDWDAAMRLQNVDVLDAATGRLLDSREIANFSGGHHLVWNITGHVVLRISALSSTTAVVSGVFID